MSKATKTALDEAIAAHVSSESDDAILIGYILQTVGIPTTAEDTSHSVYSTYSPDGQPYHSGLGLIHMALEYYELDDDDDD